jgi:hypothetical protein
MPWGTTHPVHDQLASVGADWDFDAPVNYYEEASLTYLSLNTVLSDWDFENPEESTYGNVVEAGQFIVTSDSLDFGDDVDLIYTFDFDDSLDFDDDVELGWVVSLSDSLDFADSVALGWVIEFSDSLDFSDSVLTLPVIAADSLDFGDETQLEFTFDFDDSLSIDDSTALLWSLHPSDSLDMADSTHLNYTFSIDDRMNLADSTEIGFGIDAEDSLDFGDSTDVRRTITFSFGSEVKIIHRFDESFSTRLNIIHYAPPPTQQLANLSNSMSPTVIIGGVETVVTGSTQHGTGNQISLDFAETFGSCGIQQYQLNTAINNVGTFEIYADTKFADANDTIFLCGLKCHVKDVGPFTSDSGEGFLISGVCGPSAQMNKKLFLTAHNTTGLKDLAAQFPLQQPPSAQWSTIEAAAKAIAAKAGISLIWTTFDAPLQDAFIETNMRAGEAIISLASRVGGVTVWDGADALVVCTPYPGYGAWEGIPTCSLWGRGGMVGPILHVDMDNETAILPVDLLHQVTIALAPSGLKAVPIPKVEPIHVISSKLKPDAPPLYMRVAGDFKLPAKVQILVSSEDQVGPTFTTINKDEWFDASYPLETMEDKKKALILQPTDIPNALRNGAFHMTVGYVRDTSGIDALHDEQVSVFGERKVTLMTGAYERLRYLRWQYANANFPLFGSMPLPGNQTTLTFKGNTITGTIESVSISGGRNTPPEVRMSIGTYARISFDRPLQTISGIVISNGGPH